LATTLTVAAGCGGGNEDRVKVSLALDAPPNARHAGLFVAQGKGYFKADGLDVSLAAPADPSAVLKTVGEGKADFGVSDQPSVLLARAQGIPVVAIAAMAQHPLSAVLTLRSSGIARPRDLAGKKVGYAGVPLDEALLKTMVEKDGGDFRKVELVNVGAGLVPAMLARRVDAMVGADWTRESALIEQQGQQAVVLRMEQWGAPDYYGMVLVTNENMLKVRPQVVLRLMLAVLKGYQDAGKNLDGAVAALADASPGLDKEVDGLAIRLLAPTWTDTVPSFGSQTAERWRALSTWMQAQDLLAKPVEADRAFTNDYVEEIGKRQ
jgi:putative hydroxymethylpyrimidine transport system substrate-binding protein